MSIPSGDGGAVGQVVDKARMAILVLGAAVWQDGPSPTLRRRAATAAAVWHDGGAAFVLASGGTGLHPPSEARAIADLLIAAGVPDRVVLLEDRSRSTLENIAFSRPILARHGINRVILVTDRTHAPRARMTARAFGLVVETRSPTLREARWRTVVQQGLRETLAFPVYARRLRPVRRALLEDPHAFDR